MEHDNRHGREEQQGPAFTPEELIGRYLAELEALQEKPQQDVVARRFAIRPERSRRKRNTWGVSKPVKVEASRGAAAGKGPAEKYPGIMRTAKNRAKNANNMKLDVSANMGENH